MPSPFVTLTERNDSYYLGSNNITELLFRTITSIMTSSEDNPEALSSSSSSSWSSSSSSPQSLVFDSFGLLEQILSFSETPDLLAATTVNRQWKHAGRQDELWKSAIRRMWKDKKGSVAGENWIFWRSLFTKETVRTMTQEQVLCMFRHPLLTQKYNALEQEIKKAEDGKLAESFLQRFVQVHMLDVMSEGVGGTDDDDDGDDVNTFPYHMQPSRQRRRHFFSDLYFGSLACSMMDSHRNMISIVELCTPFGFDMYFKIEQDDLDEMDQENRNNENLQTYEEQQGILLYRHSTCYFRQDRDFRIVLKQYVHSYHPTDLKWRWLEMGKRIQVGPYPALTVSRRKDWGWKLENLHVVMYLQDGPWPPPEIRNSDDDGGIDNDDYDNDSISSGYSRSDVR
jgi:hypothetical protein